MIRNKNIYTHDIFFKKREQLNAKLVQKVRFVIKNQKEKNAQMKIQRKKEGTFEYIKK